MHPLPTARNRIRTPNRSTMLKTSGGYDGSTRRSARRLAAGEGEMSPSNPVKFLNKIVYLGLGPSIAMIPEIEQGVLVARHPIDDLRRQLAYDLAWQAGGDGRNVGNRNGKARLRPSRLQEIFHPRPV